VGRALILTNKKLFQKMRYRQQKIISKIKIRYKNTQNKTPLG
jgi:hypothetical protein